MSELEDKPELYPENYRWGGFIYYNPRDARYFVPKKNPALGVTINFAKPLSFLILLPIVFILIVALVLPKK